MRRRGVAVGLGRDKECGVAVAVGRRALKLNRRRALGDRSGSSVCPSPQVGSLLCCDRVS